MPKRRKQQPQQSPQNAILMIGVIVVVMIVGVSLTLYFSQQPTPEAASVANVASAPQNLPPELVRGQELYNQYCASCHGIDGEGQPNWKSPGDDGYRPAPPHDNTGHTWHHGDYVLLDATANGIPGTAMPGFSEQMTEEEMILVIEYIKTFWGPEEKAFQLEVSSQQGGTFEQN